MEAKTYILKFANETQLLTDNELRNFIDIAVIHNRDIKRFEIIEIPK